MPKPRHRLVSLSDTPYYHCISRCVRRAYLCGIDISTGCSYEHRRMWIVNRLEQLSGIFALDMCAYAVMGNHYHIVVQIDAARCAGFSNREVAERWLQLFKTPSLVDCWLRGEHLNTAELFVVEGLIAHWRKRLCDLSWFMRCINEFIARRANEEDQCTGRFWEGRFKSQALLDERALLSCMAYVDLNPIRAGLAQTPETSGFTSIQQRITNPLDQFLMPFSETGKPGRTINFRFNDYLQLVDWAGRSIRGDKRGAIPQSLQPILHRLGIEQDPLVNYLARNHAQLTNALGPASLLRKMAANLGMKFIRGISLGKQLYPEPG